jgi:hypothetical protein
VVGFVNGIGSQVDCDTFLRALPTVYSDTGRETAISWPNNTYYPYPPELARPTCSESGERYVGVP